MSNEKYLLEVELASICKKPLPSIVSINSFVYIYMWPDHAAILHDGECWQFFITFGPGACI